MLNGGYKIIDFKDINIDTSDGAIITGFMKALKIIT